VVRSKTKSREGGRGSPGGRRHKEERMNELEMSLIAYIGYTEMKHVSLFLYLRVSVCNGYKLPGGGRQGRGQAPALHGRMRIVGLPLVGCRMGVRKSNEALT